jgi:septum formation inhibitor-activating ATPase MinD
MKRFFITFITVYSIGMTIVGIVYLLTINNLSTIPQQHSVVKTTNKHAPSVESTTTTFTDVYYSSCEDVRGAGLAPLYKGDPGYRQGLDRNSDGIACN